MFSWLLWVGLFASISSQGFHTRWYDDTLSEEGIIKRRQDDNTTASPFVRGQKWQIILTGQPDMSKMPLPPIDAPVWDIDLFDNEASTIAGLKAAGKIVICYFSAGTREDWRDDANQFPAADTGKVLPQWPNEKWIKVSSQQIRNIMASRIKLAGSKGCDAIDPDNTDGYQNDNGLNLKAQDAIDYMKWMQQEAAKYGMGIGLKNSLDIVPQVSSFVDFAVNEECAKNNECNAYNAFLASGKPVFHIEYPASQSLDNLPAAEKTRDCANSGATGMSTVIKTLALDGTTIYCVEGRVDTPTKGAPSNPGRTSRPVPPPRTTTRPPPTSRPPPTTTTPRPPPTSSPRPPPPTSSARPTSSPRPPPPATSSQGGGGGGGGGCKSKHWDQCGGQNWNGCTQCESPYQCKGVSPPYYYQCL